MKHISEMFRKKINNKGNTLGIVVVGILLLSILGTLILNVTAANYQMKIVDSQSKKNFYYVEKAIDEIYAGIGVEAMSAVSEAYQYVLSNMVGLSDEGIYSILNNDEAKTTFTSQYFEKLKHTYMEYEDTGFPMDFDDVITALKGYVIDVDKVTINIEPLSTTDVMYNEDDKQMIFKDIKVSSRTSSGYYTSVITDFIVGLPNVDLGFSDTDSKNWDRLYEYALVVDGYESIQNRINNSTETLDDLLHITRMRLDDRNTASITVNSSWNGNPSNIIGNIYVGTNSLTKKNAVEVKANAELSVSSTNFISAGSIVLRNAVANFNGIEDESLLSYGLKKGALRLWSNNLSTEGTSQDILNINGDCIIADDLEVNGINSKVRIKGNYFGYGYAGSDVDETIEANSTDSPLYTNPIAIGEAIYEHEKRSAIIINGKNADVILEENDKKDKLVLGGRAYIDLETGYSTGNATYMTGESVSLKGNQNLYKASAVEDLGTIIYANPVSYEFIRNGGYILGESLNYVALGIDPTKIIAKRVNNGNSIYFYKYTNNPVSQTQYFLDQVHNSFITRDSIQTQITNLNVENLLLNYEKKNLLSVGAITQVDGRNLQSYDNSINGVTNGKLDTNFMELINEMRYRYGFISSELENFDGIDFGDLSNRSNTAKNTTVFSNFVDQDKFIALMSNGPIRYEEQNIEEKYAPREVAEEFCERVFGKSVNEINLGVTMMDNARKGGDQLSAEREYGVIVASGDVNISKDFTGIILCGGNLTVNNGATVTACPELIEFLALYDPYLSQLFDTGGAGLGGKSIIDVDNMDYHDLVSLENWRKN